MPHTNYGIAMNKQIQNDQDRLAENQKALLDAMPELVFLVHENGSVEHMNAIANAFLTSSGYIKEDEKVVKELEELLHCSIGASYKNYTGKGILIDQDFESSAAPFAGYNGDNLYWLILSPAMAKVELENYHYIEKDIDDGIVGSSPLMNELHRTIRQVSGTDITVLITGESGTGKELVANSLYLQSQRRDKPFLVINCSAISDQLLESDLFGYEKGSFTGAEFRRKGKFEVVDGGTIFLDEIGDISPRMQSVLLRVLQNGEIIRVGGNKPIKVNVRVIAATNRDLVKAVADGRFRLDLFYRLSIIKIHVPSLKERKTDIRELAAFFMRKYCRIYDREINTTPSDELVEYLESYDWPGNVRELENVIQRAILMSEHKNISLRNISFDMVQKERPESIGYIVSKFDGKPLKHIIDHVEKEIIEYNLKNHRGNVANTADSLDICKAALYEKMKRHSIVAKDFR